METQRGATQSGWMDVNTSCTHWRYTDFDLLFRIYLFIYFLSPLDLYGELAECILNIHRAETEVLLC